MRKMFVGSLVFVFLIIVLTVYLKYDTKRFIQELPQPRKTETQQQADTRQIHTVTSAETDKIATQALEKADKSVSSEKPEDFTQEVDKTNGNTVFDAEVPGIKPETENTGLSPELEKLFTEYYPISQQLNEISTALNPLKNTAIAYGRRTLEIFAELNGEDDEQIQKTLGDEFDAIKAKRAELTPQIKELEDRRSQLAVQQDILFATYGLTDYRDFWRNYGHMFKTWQMQK